MRVRAAAILACASCAYVCVRARIYVCDSYMVCAGTVFDSGRSLVYATNAGNLPAAYMCSCGFCCIIDNALTIVSVG